MTPIKLSVSDILRFDSKVEKNELCWLWTGELDDKGYGRLKVNYKWLLAARISWTIQFGDPGNICVLHQCDNPPCVRPDHLFLGTHKDNAVDRTNKGRSAVGNKNGSRIYPERIKRGIEVSKAKLSEADIKSIRAWYGMGGVSYGKLARQFGVVKQCIAAIVNWQTWKHVA